MMEVRENQRGINGFTLKMVAVVSMFIDHFAATVLAGMLRNASPDRFWFVSDNWQAFHDVYQVMRGIGRFAFPIYCFLIVEGFMHTRSVAKYAARLFVFALLSEIPFDLAFRHTLWDFSYNNVFLTLVIGLVVIWGLRWCSEHILCVQPDGTICYGRLLFRGILNMIFIFAGMTIAEFLLHTDYGAAGIIAIVVMYLLRRHPKSAVAATVILLAILSSELEIVALPVVLFIAYYNGTRGRQLKYFFYAFYPVHLLVLVGLCYILGI